MRAVHLPKNVFAGKLAGVLVTTGLNNSGADQAASALTRFCLAQGWLLVAPAVVGTWEEGCDEGGRTKYRRGADADPQAQKQAEALAESVIALAKSLA